MTKLSQQWGATALARAAQGSLPLEHYFDTCVIVSDNVAPDDDASDASIVSVDDDDERSLSDDSDSTKENEWDEVLW